VEGEYAHNQSKACSKDIPYDSDFAKNFKNGTPFGEIKKDGELNGFMYPQKDAKSSVPFVVVMHGCDGMVTSGKKWRQHVAAEFNKAGIGAHRWALTYRPAAEKDMMQTIIVPIKTKCLARAVESR